MYLTYSTLTGVFPTDSDLKERLAKLNRGDAIGRLAWFSSIIRCWETPSTDTSERKLREYVLPSWTSRIQWRIAENGEAFVFSRMTILWLMRKVFRICTADAPRIDTREQLQTLAECCLIANDLMVSWIPMQTALDVACAMIPSTDAFPREDGINDIARMYEMLVEIPNRSDVPRIAAFAGNLSELLGFSVSDYGDLAFSVATKPHTATPDDIVNYKIPLVQPADFRTTTIEPQEAERFLNSISRSEAEFSEAIAVDSSPEVDFTMFRAHPCLRTENGFIALDPGYLLDKAGSSVFWTAVKAAPDKEAGDRLLQTYGELFDQYANSVLRLAATERRRVLSSPHFEGNPEDQAFDACVQEGRTLIVFEHKATTIRNDKKYADDPDILRAVLEERFVVGEPPKRKGLNQLRNGLLRFQAGEALVDPATGERVQRDAISTVFPVLVHLDYSLRTFGLNRYFADRFRELVRFKQLTVAPVVVMSIRGLEDIEGLLPKYAFSELLESYLGQLKRDRSTFFILQNIPMLIGRERMKSESERRFERRIEELCKRVFPNAENDDSNAR